MIKTSATLKREQWMSDLGMHCPDLKVRNVIIPSTHNSLSYTIKSVGLLESVSVCQNDSATSQL